MLVHEGVDGLDLREQLAVVQVRRDRPRLHHVLVDPGQLVAALDERRGRAAEHAVELRDDLPLRDRRDRPQRRDERHAREVERARDERDRRHGQRLVGALGEQREDPAEAPADELHRAPAGVLGHGADRAAGSRRRSSARARARGRRSGPGRSRRGTSRGPGASRCSASEQPRRRSKQSAGAASGGTSRTGPPRGAAPAARERQVAVHAALRALVDQRRRHRPPVGQPAAEGDVEEVGRRRPPRRTATGWGARARRCMMTRPGYRLEAPDDDHRRRLRGPPPPARPVGPAQAGPGPLAGAHRARRGADVRPAGRAWAAESAPATRSTPAELAKMAKKRHATLARFEGAATGVGGVVTMVPDLVALAWIQSRLVFYVAAAYGYDPTDPMRPAEALVLFDFYADPATARRALDGIGSTVVEAYIGNKLQRDEALALRLAKMLGHPLGAQARRPRDPGRRDRLQRHRQRAPHARAGRQGDPLLRRLAGAAVDRDRGAVGRGRVRAAEEVDHGRDVLRRREVRVLLGRHRARGSPACRSSSAAPRCSARRRPRARARRPRRTRSPPPWTRSSRRRPRTGAAPSARRRRRPRRRRPRRAPAAPPA